MLRKYPRTRHLQGSRLQPGDEDLEAVPLSALSGRYVVVEEKVDGANAGISFGPGGETRLQSRGHYLTGGHRERHFGLLKAWATAHRDRLRDVLGTRYVLYGEWLYAKHTVFYDRLPHYLMEFDVLDLETDRFLSTSRRRSLLAGSPVRSVRVLWEGTTNDPAALPRLVARSVYKSESWRERLGGLSDAEQVARETDPSDLMEGLYVKVEADGCVSERFKWIRHDFLMTVLDSSTHWLDRPIVPNQLEGSVEDLFQP